MKKRTLGARYKASYETRDSGGRGASAFAWNKVKGEVKFFKVKEGKNRISIIPYEVKTKNHPLVKSGTLKIGDIDYVMDYYIHKNVGASGGDVVCIKRTFGKPCPICEMAKEAQDAGKTEDYQQLKPSRRVIYNVIDEKNPEAGIQIFEASQYLFEKELIEEARNAEAGGEMTDFADIDEGKSVSFRASEATFGKNKYFEFKSFQFLDREEELDGDLIDQAHSFDELMVVLSYQDIAKLLHGGDDEEPAASDDSDEDEDEEEEKPAKPAKAEEKPPVKKGARKAEEAEPEEEEEPAPAQTKKPVEKAKAPAKKGTTQECPSGHTFGTDCDEFDDCNKCEIWELCVKAQ